jgi:hypothetical protein
MTLGFEALTGVNSNITVHLNVSRQVFTDVSENIHLFYVQTLLFPEDGGSKFLQKLVKIYQTTWCHNPEDNNLRKLGLRCSKQVYLHSYN